MIKTVFFDLGNTIIDYHSGNLTDEEKDFLGLWRMYSMLQSSGLKVCFEELTNTFYYPWISKLSERKNCSKEFNMLDFMQTKITQYCNTTDLILEFHEPTARFAVPMPGIEYVLRRLKSKGISIGIISNSPIPGKCHDMTLKHLNLLDYFSYRFYSYDVGIRKPDHRMFWYALKVSMTRENESIMIGDRFEMDVLPAQEIGMQGLWYVGKNSINNIENLEWTISDFTEILKRIE